MTTSNKLDNYISEALDGFLDMTENLSRDEKKKFLMALIVTVYEEAYNAANPLPVVYSEKLN